MAEGRTGGGWVVLPCVETMAHAEQFAPLRGAAELRLLPVALPATLAFRVRRDSPDAIVIAGDDGFVAGLSQHDTLREVFADTPALLLMEQPGASLLRSAARAHITSVLPMDVSVQQLTAAIAATVAGLAVSLPRAPTGSTKALHDVEHLTARELEVLRLMARGNRNKEIAASLRISEHTAKFHVSAVIAKLGAHTRTEAVTLGVTRGLVAI